MAPNEQAVYKIVKQGGGTEGRPGRGVGAAPAAAARAGHADVMSASPLGAQNGETVAGGRACRRAWRPTEQA